MIADSLSEGLIVIDFAGGIAFANPSARLLLGCSETEDVEGLPIDVVFRLTGDEHNDGIVREPWKNAVRQGVTIHDDDAVVLTMRGKKRSIAYACVPLAESTGKLAVVITFRDIGSLKQAQWDAMQASRMASVGQLAAGIAHEINTPIQYVGDNLRFVAESFEAIAKIVAAAKGVDTALDSMIADQDVEYLCKEIPTAISQSLEGVSQVARIVLSMREFSHPGSSDKVMTDINRALDSTLIVCRNTWKHVAEASLDSSSPIPLVPCFAGELNQVFLNLIVNASHAIEAAGRTGQGRIHIKTFQDGAWVVIRIEDNGTGVPSAIKDKIFDPFFTTKPVGKGTGQGLAISRDVVVVKHKGRMEVGGKEGEGAVFTIWLPIQNETKAT